MKRLANLRSWKKGVSGNPKGTKKLKDLPPEEQIARRIIKDIREAAREYAAPALETLHSAIKADDCPWPAKITAANSLLDRGFGKPDQKINDESARQITWVQIIQEVMQRPVPPPPERLGEIMTPEKWREIQRGRTIEHEE